MKSKWLSTSLNHEVSKTPLIRRSWTWWFSLRTVWTKSSSHWRLRASASSSSTPLPWSKSINVKGTPSKARHFYTLWKGPFNPPPRFFTMIWQFWATHWFLSLSNLALLPFFYFHICARPGCPHIPRHRELLCSRSSGLSLLTQCDLWIKNWEDGKQMGSKIES